MWIYRLGKVSASRLVLRGIAVSLKPIQLGFRPTHGEKVRTITDIPKAGCRDPPVEASNSVPLNNLLEYPAGGHRREEGLLSNLNQLRGSSDDTGNRIQYQRVSRREDNARSYHPSPSASKEYLRQRRRGLVVGQLGFHQETIAREHQSVQKRACRLQPRKFQSTEHETNRTHTIGDIMPLYSPENRSSLMMVDTALNVPL